MKVQPSNAGRGSVSFAHSFLEQFRENALGDHHDVTLMYDEVAHALKWNRHLDEAAAVYEKSLELKKTLYGQDHFQTSVGYTNLAKVLLQSGKLETAALYFQEAQTLTARISGSDSREAAIAMTNTAVAMRKLLRTDEAEKLLFQSTQIMERSFNTGFVQTGITYSELLCFDGRHKEAEDMYKKAMACYRDNHEIPLVANVLNNLATLKTIQNEHGAAEKYLREALNIYLDSVGPANHQTASAKWNLADTLLKQKTRHKEAVDLLSEAVQVYEDTLGKKHEVTQQCKYSLRSAKKSASACVIM